MTFNPIPAATDSVYDVCAKLHKGRTLETDAVRPEDPEERVMLAEHHYYGDRKLLAEEELLGQRQHGGFPFVILRLPDVIGPRDNTHRFWIYQLWIKVLACVCACLYMRVCVCSHACEIV